MGNIKLIIICLFLSIAIFIVDILVPVGVATGVLYILVILLSLQNHRKKLPIYLAIGCSILVVIDLFLSLPGGELWSILSNSAIALIAIWVVTIFSSNIIQTKNMLHRSESNYRNLVTTSPICIHEINLDGEIISMNPSGLKMMGVDNEEQVCGLNYLDVPIEEDRERISQLLLKAKAGEASNFEFAAQGAEGILYFSSSFNPMKNEVGNVIKLMGLTQDITESKESVEVLKAEKNRIRAILDLVADPIFVKDNDHRITLANSAFYDIFSLDENSVIGKTLVESVPENERVHFLRVDREVLDTGISDLREEELTVKGYTRTIITNKVRYFDESGQKYLVCSIHDITEHKLLEEQLQIRQRMDSIGTLIGGIAHDFNNILAALKGNIELLSIGNDNFNQKQIIFLENAAKSTNRAVELIGQLQSLSSVKISDDETIDIHDIAEEVFGLLEGTSDRLIGKEIKFNKGEFLVTANAGELNQVLLNLATNSIHAIEERKVTNKDFIRISAEHYQAKTGHSTVLTTGDYVHLSFEDSGSGMSAQVLSKAFEPLFTTKDKGSTKGQGLGLAMVYNIVTKHNQGFIKIESEEGKGTTFHLYLPKAQSELIAESESIAAAKGGTETLLLVEDDIMVATMAEAMLTDAGYIVLIANDGIEALEIYTQKIKLIAAVILDLNMPKMSGTKVFEEMLIINPDVKVIISSGYGVEDSQQGILAEAKGNLSKPYALDDLSRVVRYVLDS